MRLCIWIPMLAQSCNVSFSKKLNLLGIVLFQLLKEKVLTWLEIKDRDKKHQPKQTNTINPCKPSILGKQSVKPRMRHLIRVYKKHQPKQTNTINTCKPSILFVGHRQTVSENPDQMPQNAASDQGLHCLLTWYSIRTWMKMKNTTQQSK